MNTRKSFLILILITLLLLTVAIAKAETYNIAEEAAFARLLNREFNCPDIKFTNRTYFPWNDKDFQVLDTAKINCSKHYPDNPCVKEFIKTGTDSWQVLCTVEDNET